MSANFVKSALSATKEFTAVIDGVSKPPIEVIAPHKQPVLPQVLFLKTRGYIESVVFQINICYESACYDACAVMIRRLIEMLLIEVFEHRNEAAKIKNADNDYLMLSGLITIAEQQVGWNMGRNVKAGLKNLKTIGDQSAHSRRYNARRTYIDDSINDIRIVSEELLYLAGMKN